MKAIINTKLVMTDGIIWDGVVLFENDKILAADWADKVTVPADAEIIDAGGLYTAPGLVDIHNHGATQCWFHENPIEASKVFLKHGCTTVLPTFYHNMDKQTMIAGAERVREASKTGAGAELLWPMAEQAARLPHIRLRGLMGIPPAGSTSEENRSYFANLRQLYVQLGERYPDLPIDTLSMGMSGSFEEAILEGATIVRVGSAIYGPRNYQK